MARSRGEVVNVPQAQQGGYEPAVSLDTKFSNSVTQGMSDRDRVVYGAKPMDIQAFRTVRTAANFEEFIEDFVPVVSPEEGMNGIQYMPGFSLVSFQKSQQSERPLRPHQTYTGRIGDMEVVTAVKDDLGIPQGRRNTYSFHDSLWTPGKLWIEAEVKKARPEHRFTVLGGLSGEGLSQMTAIFMRDPRTVHPLSNPKDPNNPYNGQCDYRLVDVMSSACVNPQNGYLDFSYRQAGADKDTKVIGWQNHNLESAVSEHRKRIIGNNPIKNGEAFYRTVMRANIEGWTKLYSRLTKIVTSPDPDVRQFDFADPLNQTFKELESKNFLAAKEMRLQWISVGEDPGEIGKFFRGGMLLARQDAHAASYAAFHKRLTRSGKLDKTSQTRHQQELNRQKRNEEYIFREFVEATAMSSQTAALNASFQHVGNPDSTFPIRMQTAGYDEVDFDYSQMLGFVTKGRYKRQAQMAYARYGVDEVEGLSFEMAPTPGNYLQHSNQSEGGEPHEFRYGPGLDMPYGSPHGAFAYEMFESVYNPRKASMFPIMGSYSLIGSGMGIEDPLNKGKIQFQHIEGIAVNCLEAPALFARSIVESGFLENGSNRLESNPTFFQLFQNIESTVMPREIIVAKTIGGNLVAQYTLAEGEAVSIVRETDKDGQKTELMKCVLTSKAALFDAEQKQLPAKEKQTLNPDIRKAMAAHMIANTPLLEDQEEVGAIALLHGVPHIKVFPKSQSVSTKVMPNENRHVPSVAERTFRQTASIGGEQS